MTRIQVDKLQRFMEVAFTKLGVTEKDAKTCAEILITSDLRGIESHGIGRLRMYVDRIHKGLIETDVQPMIVRESPTTAVVDGQHGIGMIIAHKSMQMAIDKARQYGMGAVAVRNSTHFGIDGYYPLMAISAGMIGMSFTNARPSVAPTFGVQPMLGTNPIAFGAPSDEDFPFLFDAATSITQRGKIEVLHRKDDQPAYPDWVIGSEGQSLTNPGEILKMLVNGEAALVPLGGSKEESGGHKGYDLSTIVEILSSALQSGAFLSALSGLTAEGKETRFRVGHFFMAINVENFLPLEEFKHNIGELLRELRASRKMPGKDRIYTAGEKEYYIEKEIRQKGVYVNDNLMNDLLHVIEILGITDFTLD
jgi:L-2-hydroxycarboxylate dehydrogenase (NAD+)